MGHTNSTANLSLPQFIGTDKPTWLGDVNGAFLAIDGYAGTNDAAVAAAASDASSAISQAAAAVNTANTANTTAGNASTTANNAIGVANTANAIAGTVDAKVGLLADLNTTDRTSIVNAINETNIILQGSSSASGANSAKLAEIETLYNDLSAAQKARAYVKHGNAIFQCFGVNGVFSRALADSTGYKLDSIYLSSHEFFVNANGTSTDYSATVDSTVFELYA